MKLLIDGGSIFKRYFFAIYKIDLNRDLSYYDEIDITEFYDGVISTINSLKNRFYIPLNRVFITEDVRVDNRYWRHFIYDKYKNRKLKVVNDKNVKRAEHMGYIMSLYEKHFNILKNSILKDMVNFIGYDYLESDDIIYILTKYSDDKTVVVSNDKDLKQICLNKNGIFYSTIEKTVIDNFNKKDLIKHIILGDSADTIPSIFAETSFSSAFIEFLEENGIKYTSVYDISKLDIFKKLKKEFLIKYKDKKIYDRSPYKIGRVKLEKDLDNILNMIKSDRLLSDHLLRNSMLIDFENIPKYYVKPVVDIYNGFSKRLISDIDIARLDGMRERVGINRTLHSLFS